MLLIFLVSFTVVNAQEKKKAYLFSGVVYDEKYRPLPYTHVIARGSGQGDVTDSLGIFLIYILEEDHLSFYNIAFNDTSTEVNLSDPAFHIQLKRKAYPLKEARIFDWGSGYDEFLSEAGRRGVPEDMGDKMGLPNRDPNYKPFDQNDALLKSTKFLFASPLSYVYYNYSRHAKNTRKALNLMEDQEQIDQFEALLSPDNISSITGLKDKALEEFMIYLNSNLACTYKCTEVQLITEVYAIWKRYSEIYN